MKNRTQQLSFLGLLLLVFVVSCGQPDETSEHVNIASSTLNDIQQRGELVVCSDVPYEPFGFEDDNGDLVGYEIDLIQQISYEIFGNYDSYEIIVTGFDVIIPSLIDKNCDVIASAMTRTLQRALSVHFTEGYVDTGQIVMINSARSGEVAAYSDLDQSGKIITVQVGTTGEAVAEELFPDADVRSFDLAPLALQEVLSGRADAILFDDTFLGPSFVQAGAGEVFLCCAPLIEPEADIGVLRSKISPLTRETLSFALRKGDEDFLNWMNLFVNHMNSSILVNEQMMSHYGLPAAELNRPLLGALKRKWGFEPTL